LESCDVVVVLCGYTIDTASVRTPTHMDAT
jgi:hypothetical protein